jgi:hypothetical protein
MQVVKASRKEEGEEEIRLKPQSGTSDNGGLKDEKYHVFGSRQTRTTNAL